MAAGSTYTPIASYTVTSAQASYTFSSISGSYTDLILIMNASASTGAYEIQVGNGTIDTGTNYSRTYIYGDGTSAASGRGSNLDRTYIASGSSSFGTTVIHLMNYSNSTTYKTLLMRGNDVAAVATAAVSLWRNTAAINTIKIAGYSSANLASGSTFTLYGILSAQEGTMTTTTYNLIAKQTIGAGGASSVTFSSIPQTYTDLKVVYSVRCSDTSNNWNVLLGYFNTDSTSGNYPGITLYAYSTTTGSTTVNKWFGYLPNGNKTANTFGNGEFYVPNYSVNGVSKSVSVDSVTESNSATLVPSQLTATRWTGTNPINSMTFTCDAGNFVEFSTFYLYGILKA